MQSMLTIDPGENTGWAYFEKDIKPVETGAFHNKEIKQLRIETMKLLQKYRPNKVIIEDVEFHGNRTTAAGKKFTKLCAIIGVYIGVCCSLNIKYKLVPTSKWKGQLKNKVVRTWVKDYIKQDYHPVHTLCSVAIGLHERGLF